MLQALDRTSITNRILLSLPQPTLERLMPALEPFELVRGRPIDRVDAHIDHLYFVNRGMISLVKTMHDGRTVEIGAVGVEGVTNPTALFGLDVAVLESMVQIPGIAFRVKRDTLRAAAQQETMLYRMIQKYARFAIGMLAQTAACNRLHALEARCCRWLLVAHDNALADTFPLTHEFLAMMLGVQRTGVSIAANMLREAGLIHYSRSRVTLTNRDGLEEAACECYGAIRADLDRLFAEENPKKPATV